MKLNGNEFSSANANRWFKKVYKRYLRHTMASHSLVKLIREKMDIYAALPLLAACIGHKSLTEQDMLRKVKTYARVHFEEKYKDVYSTPTATQRLVFDLLGIPYSFKGKVSTSGREL